MKRGIIVTILLLSSLLLMACSNNKEGDQVPDHTGPADSDIKTVFDTVCSADEALALAKETDTVVLESRGCTSGNDIWDTFYQTATGGKPAAVLCAHYYTLDPKQMSTELYEEEKDRYPVLYFYLVEYDGKEYTVTTRESAAEAPESQETYQHLLHLTGDAPSTARYASYDNYVLVDDPDVTWEDLMAGMFSSQSDAWIRHCTVYRNYFGWKENA